MSPCVAVADLLDRLARRQLAERMADRGESHRHALVALQRRTDLGRPRRARGDRLQDLFDHARVVAALRTGAASSALTRRASSLCRRRARRRACRWTPTPPRGGCRSSRRRFRGRRSPRPGRRLCCRPGCRPRRRPTGRARGAAPPATSGTAGGRRFRRESPHFLHRRLVTGCKGLFAHGFHLGLVRPAGRCRRLAARCCRRRAARCCRRRAARCCRRLAARCCRRRAARWCPRRPSRRRAARPRPRSST